MNKVKGVGVAQIEKYTANQTTPYYEVTSFDYQPYAFVVMLEIDEKMGIASSAGRYLGALQGVQSDRLKAL